MKKCTNFYCRIYFPSHAFLQVLLPYLPQPAKISVPVLLNGAVKMMLNENNYVGKREGPERQ